jgi:hypothetical protein
VAILNWPPPGTANWPPTAPLALVQRRELRRQVMCPSPGMAEPPIRGQGCRYRGLPSVRQCSRSIGCGHRRHVGLHAGFESACTLEYELGRVQNEYEAIARGEREIAAPLDEPEGPFIWGQGEILVAGARQTFAILTNGDYHVFRFELNSAHSCAGSCEKSAARFPSEQCEDRTAPRAYFPDAGSPPWLASTACTEVRVFARAGRWRSLAFGGTMKI